jgi:hypothetical protein
MLIDARYELIDEDRIKDTDGILITGTEYLHYMDLMRKYYDLLDRVTLDNAIADREVEEDYGDSWMDELEGYPPPRYQPPRYESPETYFSNNRKNYAITCGTNSIQ